jgi:hypothetical protein
MLPGEFKHIDNRRQKKLTRKSLVTASEIELVQN